MFNCTTRRAHAAQRPQVIHAAYGARTMILRTAISSTRRAPSWG
jgi:hypothetical protein